MSELAVGSLKGLAANDFVIDVAAGSTLNVPPPAILQVVSTAKTDTFTTASNTFTTITGLTASITPSATSSKIMMLVQLTVGFGNNTSVGHFKATRGGTDIYVGGSPGSRIAGVFGGFLDLSILSLNLSNSMIFLDSPATTSPVTYQVETRVTGGGGTVFVNRSANDDDNDFQTRGASSITLMEVAG